mgnify:CR=1 FL=1
MSFSVANSNGNEGTQGKTLEGTFGDSGEGKKTVDLGPRRQLLGKSNKVGEEESHVVMLLIGISHNSTTVPCDTSVLL